MTRRLLLEGTLATAMCLVLAGPTGADESKLKLTPGAAKVIGFKLVAVTGTLSGQGREWTFVSGATANIGRAGEFEARYVVKNTGRTASPKGAQTCAFRVVGIGFTFEKNFTDPTPPLAIGAQKNCYTKLGSLNAGLYKVYFELKD